MRYVLSIVTAVVVLGCTSRDAQQKLTNEKVKQDILTLEKKWFEYEFALDTASISPMIDSSFISISAKGISNKQQELDGIYKNISAMRSDSIFVDSFKIEEPMVKLHDNFAISIFICHTYKTAKGKHQEKRTKFYDVWKKINGQWKALSSQATVIEETQ
ncbi:MAG: nuclear transport factor 2 family protein [Bacteroidota bacterium]|jgi:hypothetical protein|nr:nuclear transport factor 2 family protein [Cytophagales bacterium]MCE2957051.1 nuclear transport factor 2 family protein [Flammeovirgaceae bacterium]